MRSTLKVRQSPDLREEEGDSWHTRELQMVAKDTDDDVPSFFVVDVDDECGDGMVCQ